MYPFKGTTWSSIRPTPEKPANMKAEGFFTIKEYDPITGVVSGIYEDVAKKYNAKFQGTIQSFGEDSYVFRFHYDYKVKETTWTRLYVGKDIADDGSVRVVVGKWHNLRESDKAPDYDEDDASSKLVRQEEGVWVATKP